MPAPQPVSLDLNNPDFQLDLFSLQQPEKLAALNTLQKIRRLTWAQVYRDNGLKWEKITSRKPPAGIEALYSLRMTQSCRAVAYRAGNTMVFLRIFSDHDATYGKK